ncbi:imidazole glycerol phosphate synthase subunit HisH [Spirosoma validum]|uniref:Imidazole glycerol phosphate synthase subunit HisH n=1 Tax=Spirosoma validum TaxID=2771355 RepID=A0A927AZ84_9BACT|nr:imidazole glycerol phosphate synthase subunit HisH [Spirosoma validum]MBD2752584.1 imidazole glycerol phosphate synthase subunit HisH [Spirosoma validum]
MFTASAEPTSADIVIVDYGAGNLRSVEKKCHRLHKAVRISSDPAVIAKADKLVLPGVGHFASGVRKLKESGIWDVLNKAVLIDQTPILGICLGMQLMTRYSEEGDVEGFGWFDAEVVRFRVSNKLVYKVPHIGWNTAEPTKSSSLLTDVSNTAMFYFVHSYYVVCHNPEDVLTRTTYEAPFASAIQKGNLYGTQFHPEKSHDLGEQLIRNFVNL